MSRGVSSLQLIWLRSDLRVHDNSALASAMAAGPTLALYLLSPRQWLAHDDAPCKVDFWLRNLRELRQALGTLNIPLLIRSIDRWDQASDAIMAVCHQHRIDSVHWNDEYGINEQRRDQAVRARLEQSGVQAHSYLDQLFFRPGTLLTRSGDYFQVFSQFKKSCLEHLHRSLPALARRVKRQAPLNIGSDPVYLEFVYNDPMLFKSLFTYFKIIKAREIHIRCSPVGVTLKAVPKPPSPPPLVSPYKAPSPPSTNPVSGAAPSSPENEKIVVVTPSGLTLKTVPASCAPPATVVPYK